MASSASTTVRGQPIKMNESWGAGIGGGLWSTGKALAAYFEANPAFLNKSLGNKRCIEVGSGNAYNGMLLATIVPTCSVVVTDIFKHVAFMKETIIENRASLENCGADVKAAEYDWGAEPDIKQLGHDQFDFIFGSDVAYRDYLHDPLIDAFDKLSHVNTVILIGVTKTDTSTEFFTKLNKRNFSYTRFHDNQLDPEFRGNIFGLYFIQRERKQ
ncbi:hypothetical protein ScalyP_jg3227 [Parmales sp. scaly parma]|nr:hypothetical protein ScalyP_jg3227 [Parmales sp. scaly parma]